MLVSPSLHPSLTTSLIEIRKRNAVTTATQLRTNRFLASSPHAMTLSRAIMSEVVDVARAKGLQVPEGTIDKLIEQVRLPHPPIMWSAAMRKACS